MSTKKETLSEALASLGITHEAHAVEGMRIWTDMMGAHIGIFDAHEGWKKVKELRQRSSAVLARHHRARNRSFLLADEHGERR